MYVVVRQSGGAWVWARGFVYLGPQLIAIRADGAAQYSHGDPVTKARKLTDASGVMTSATLTDPFGGEIASGPWALNPSQQPRKFTTYARDADTADGAGDRRYRPRWGRFDQPDPADFSYDLRDPQSLNRYSYVQNDPVNFTDPSGLARPIYGRSYVSCETADGIVKECTSYVVGNFTPGGPVTARELNDMYNSE